MIRQNEFAAALGNHLGRLRAHSGPWDILIIGGGATGVGCALDAASRGYHVALIEQGARIGPAKWWEDPSKTRL